MGSVTPLCGPRVGHPCPKFVVPYSGKLLLSFRQSFTDLSGSLRNTTLVLTHYRGKKF
jgi:hypothetical protein